MPTLLNTARALVACAAMVMAAPVDVAGQVVAEASLKAAFLRNFVKFTEWPEDVLGPAATIVVCVSNPDVATELERIVAGQSINDHALSVRRIARAEPVAGCAVAYLTGVDAHRLPELLAGFARTATLTVSDDERFAERGGVVGLFVEDGRMRFAVNVSAAERSRLRLSSKLLSLARIVRD